LETSRMRVRAFLRKLEERHFYQKYYQARPDETLKGQVHRALDEALEHNPPAIVQDVLVDFLNDVEQSLGLEDRLHAQGLKRRTHLNLFQLVGIHTLWTKVRHLLGDEMGLGKTLEVLCTFLLSGENELVVTAPREALRRW